MPLNWKTHCLKMKLPRNTSEAYSQAYTCDKMKSETINRNAADLINDLKITSRVKQVQGPDYDYGDGNLLPEDDC
jgi:hypothetical protein